MLGGEGVARLATSAVGSAGGKLSSLEGLSFSNCQIDDDVFRRLGEVLCAHVCPLLESVNVRNNRISVDGVSAFLDALSPQSVPLLECLWLEGQEGIEVGDAEKRFASDVEALLEQARAQGKVPSCFETGLQTEDDDDEDEEEADGESGEEGEGDGESGGEEGDGENEDEEEGGVLVGKVLWMDSDSES
uniref:Uncharacterized protein n=1 Tax=Chromera velia CCMP2878 TaxID=1169474 RepID=A0A0G4I6Q2_9ALVE|eukprot:Cvel_11468.t1-p1 / transcript=Cvel_11468.t1 / gene=Cvel_11468 / organism=Chromera_velia_CCMP2878 / gene_product=hypothetical protein / transcript_product=hypothetical protein / location=Cvel_scaffold722:12284-12847(+) / protein_length=188 / sequence_SO=supercontig / SO=protein_coding / is_pseudo=false